MLLSVPAAVLLGRLAGWDKDAFGKDPADRQRILRDLAEVEPLLRSTATAEIDTRKPLRLVADAVESMAVGPDAGRS